MWFELGAPDPVDPADPAGPADPTGSPRLPDTGGADQALLALGLGMVAAGGVAVTAGRRRSAAG